MRLVKTILVAVAVMAACNAYSQKSELKPYIDFLRQQNTSPVDYVFELFEDHDIVILGERDHRDMSQYELIKEIISDKRFTDKVGHIFTEVGVHNQTERANRILSGKYDDYLIFQKDLIGLYRDIDYVGIWEKYNYWYLLSTIYNINTRLNESRKLTIHLTDVEFDWDNYFDIDDYTEKYDRDSIMGHNFIYEFDKILQNDSEPRKKALVILNSPHSYQNYQTRNYLLNSAAAYIFDYYPNKVANIMINYVNSRKGKDSNDYLFDRGKWDAAFKYLDNPKLGFDMAGSPFGEVPFNGYDDLPVYDTRFKNIFTGFIFYKPISEWILMFGIPGFVDEEFKPELIRRSRLRNPDAKPEDILKYDIPYCNILKIRNHYDGDDVSREQVDEWIKYWLK